MLRDNGEKSPDFAWTVAGERPVGFPTPERVGQRAAVANLPDLPTIPKRVQ